MDCAAEPVEVHPGPCPTGCRDVSLAAGVGTLALNPAPGGVKTVAYTNALTGNARGLRIAGVKEGFGHPNSEADVDALVRKGAATFKQLGARVDEVSIPMHLASPAISTPIAVEGATHHMLNGNAFGLNWKGLYVTSLIDVHSSWRCRADQFSTTPRADFARRFTESFSSFSIKRSAICLSNRSQTSGMKNRVLILRVLGSELKSILGHIQAFITWCSLEVSPR